MVREDKDLEVIKANHLGQVADRAALAAEEEAVALEISSAWANLMSRSMELIKKSRLSSSMLLVWMELRVKYKSL